MHESKKKTENFRRESTEDQNNKAGLEKKFRLILLKKVFFCYLGHDCASKLELLILRDTL